jgi:hypothetical protein
MIRSPVLFILFAALTVASAAAQPTAAAELSFSFTRQSGSASNQFAVWIEDSQGHYIKTLYATRYTANGGWQRRASSIPLWVKQSGLGNMNRAQIDSLTGATPRTGTLSYRWDGTDSQNIALPPGDYIIHLEGTLRWENQVLYRATILLGQGPATPSVTTEYTGTPGTEQGMISAVVVRTLR